jgi:tRNA (guanine9-N1)-methyltransferase
MEKSNSNYVSDTYEKNNQFMEDKNLNSDNEEKSNIDFSSSEKISGVVQPLSKNQLKKMKRKEEWDKVKKDIRKLKKEQKKERKQKELELNPPSQEELNKLKVMVPSRKEREQENLDKIKKGIILIIDCGFEDLMNERDLISLTRQIAFSYSENRKAESPFDYILYDVDEKLWEKLKINSFEKWRGVKLVRKGEYKSIDEFLLDYTKNRDFKIENFNKEDIIYLTADSENEVNDLQENKAYIIGGIVDRNRFKNITYNKSKLLGISHGKLPIGEYIHLSSSKVMTTNHVFSMLTHYNSIKRDWKDAFMSIIPKRKLDE